MRHASNIGARHGDAFKIEFPQPSQRRRTVSGRDAAFGGIVPTIFHEGARPVCAVNRGGFGPSE